MSDEIIRRMELHIDELKSSLAQKEAELAEAKASNLLAVERFAESLDKAIRPEPNCEQNMETYNLRCAISMELARLKAEGKE